MNIVSIQLLDFKGVKNAKYDFNGKNIKITGENGIGKSTIFDAYCWVFWDKDSTLVSNPQIRPNDNRECIPTVTIELDVNGKPVTISKMQKRKESKDGKVSLTNTYEINSVPKTERDFKLYFDDLGIDINEMLTLSHPDFFLLGMNEKKAREQMRTTLFSMASTFNDYEVAQKTEDINELNALLEAYSLEEIQAMQAATMRKIKDTYGKDGEIVDAEIRGKEALRVDIDLAEIELQKNALLEQIEDNKAKQADVSKQYDEYQKLTDGIMELKFKLSDIAVNINADKLKKRTEQEQQLRNYEFKLNTLRRDLERSKNAITNAEKSIEVNTKLIEQKRTEYKTVYAEQLSEYSLNCPTCGQLMPENKVAKIKSDFEDNKKVRLQKITLQGNELKNQLDIAKDLISREKENIAKIENNILEIQTEIEKVQNIVIPADIDVHKLPEYQAIENEITVMEAQLKCFNDADNMKKQLISENDELHAQLRIVEKKLASADSNNRIDEQIAELKEKKRELEQQKANCEKILYQIDLLNKAKNEMLTEQINSYFEIVNWKMFDYLKNGSYVDTCEPLIDGKTFVAESNGALQTLAKLDIIKGLQAFYKKSYPVFVDDFSLITTNTSTRINMNCQLITMAAVDGIKELKIEVLN